MGMIEVGGAERDCALAFGDNPDGLCHWCGLNPARPASRWCSTGCGERFRANHFSSVARLVALVHAEFRCQRCDATEAIEVHHRIPVQGNRKAGCGHHQDNLEVVCEPCHMETTVAQRRAGLQLVLL